MTPQTQQSLPQLVKMSSTYKMVIPKKVEEKIRYLCRKFPNLEWSGVLFTSYTGSFETNDLVITCEDIYPMDLGSSGFTEFNMDETVAGYIADNIELFDCDLGLIHSHNTMSCFFSGTDQATLRSEGNDRNCFVSLIVNNAGDYCAAITRKVHSKKEVTTRNLGLSYKFFGKGDVEFKEGDIPNTTHIVDDEHIEYFMLDIEKEEAENPLSYLDKRFEEIEAKKKKLSSNNTILLNGKSNLEKGTWLDSGKFTSSEAKEALLPDKPIKEPMLFDDEYLWESMPEINPDEKAINSAIAKMLVCSLNFDPSNFNLKNWISRHMDNVYKKTFTTISLNTWIDFVVEFMIDNYWDDSLHTELMDSPDYKNCVVASAMIDKLSQYTSLSEYVQYYIDKLETYYS